MTKTYGKLFAEELKCGISTTENGALGYGSTGNAILDLNFKVPSYRKADENALIDDIREAIKSSMYSYKWVIRWLFYARDVRGGLGERDLFRRGILYLANKYPEIIKKIIHLIPEYGRWDDLFCLLNSRVSSEVYSLIAAQLSTDIASVRRNKALDDSQKKLPVSLLAKWMPSENASSAETRSLARKIAKHIGIPISKYRKTLVYLRKYLDVVECKMSAGQWGEIDYERVPSKANLLYKNAFERHDEQRRDEYLKDVEDGNAKINSKVVFPHEIYAKYACEIRWNNRGYISAAYEEMWKALPDIDAGDTLVVCDGSGSMEIPIHGSSVRAIDVSRSIAIYTATRMKGAFKNCFITFSARPEIVRLKENGRLADHIETISQYDDYTNTNIESVFNLILNTAINLKKSYPYINKDQILPKNVLVISDMEFDNTVERGKDQERLFQVISSKFAALGFTMPRLIFWNVNSRTNTIPVKENEAGVALVSGFSLNILKMVLSGNLDPWGALKDILISDRYVKLNAALDN